MWGPTLYTNSLAIPLMAAWGLAAHEYEQLAGVTSWRLAFAVLATSCLLGVVISFTGWRARELLTATCDSIFGLSNKMATVLANTLVWDQHASAAGIASLVACLLGAMTYQQAPLRTAQAKPQGIGKLLDNVDGGDEEGEGGEGVARANKESGDPTSPCAGAVRSRLLLVLGIAAIVTSGAAAGSVVNTWVAAPKPPVDGARSRGTPRSSKNRVGHPAHPHKNTTSRILKAGAERQRSPPLHHRTVDFSAPPHRNSHAHPAQNQSSAAASHRFHALPPTHGPNKTVRRSRTATATG